MRRWLVCCRVSYLLLVSVGGLLLYLNFRGRGVCVGAAVIYCVFDAG